MIRTSEEILNKYRDVYKSILTECAERYYEKLPLGRLFVEGYKISYPPLKG